MNCLQIKDLKKGQVQVAWQRENEDSRVYEYPIPFTDPLSVEDRKELRWYLEEYLMFPYGAERNRARAVERKMDEWGESLFNQVFVKGDKDPDPRAFYQEAVREGLEQCELCVSSDDSDFLNIPWELIKDPTAGRGYLAPSLAGYYRQRTAHKIEAPLQLSPEEAFRILLVIARPYGKSDIPLGTVARPMLEALRPFQPRIQLDLLRPPTFDALQKLLNSRRGYYHLVHFDGHGVFVKPSRGAMLSFGAKPDTGHLVFEKDDGSEQIVNSEDLGQVLNTCKVPLFVLNACQSAEEGKSGAFSSVASQLVAIGSRGVVAMSYSVYASAAAQFIRRFYERLTEHASLAEAVAAGRNKLYSTRDRYSVVGPLELQDWIVPVLYQKGRGYTPIPEGVGIKAAEEDKDEALKRKHAQEACPEGRFGFIGRDYDILQIERNLRDEKNPFVLLTGMGGIGKTELAFGFARWYVETGGCPGGVFATSFKEKADFGQVIGSTLGFATDFSSLPEQKQWEFLVSYLRENPSLLVWDNFETVNGYPAGAQPLATQEERDKLSRFLKALRGGKSRVLITTRKLDEDWLGVKYQLLELVGLTERDAGQMAKEVLDTVGRKPEEFKDDQNYSKLISLLRGHPRSLEVVLPQLRTHTPRELIDALQLRVDKLGESLEDASLSLAFSQMSERTRKHLPFLGLFVSYVHAGMLGIFIGPKGESGKVYSEMMGENLDKKGWERVLDEAASGGLLRPLGASQYEMHPTIPSFLRIELASCAGQKGLDRLDSEFLKFYAGWAVYYFDDIQKGEKDAIVATTVEEANLLRALRLAEMTEEWGLAQDIVQLLGEFYKVRHRTNEWYALRTRLLNRIGKEMPPDSPRNKGNLWAYVLGEEASSALSRNELDAAEEEYKRIITYFQSLRDPSVDPHIATGAHQLGIIAEERQQFDQAEQWYRKALEIFEWLGLEREVASDYHHLGIIAEERQQFDQAEGWYRKALEIFERLGLPRETVAEYHHLGRIAVERQQFNQAEGWYRKALEICEQLGLESEAAREYHHLGMIAEERQQFDQAEGWYRKALEICEQLGLESEAAREYHHLGMIAEERQQFDQAEGWYRKALEIKERLGLEREAASDYHQLGMIAQERLQFDQAEGWFREALKIFERLGLERYAAYEYHQLGIIAQNRQQIDQAEGEFRKALEIFERLGLQRDAAREYHHLGMIAQKREQFDKAEGWYRKALEIYQHLDHPPLIVNTLAQMGVLYRLKKAMPESVLWSGRALAIAAEYKMRVAGQILADLARNMDTMGEKEFTAAWKEAFQGQEPPLELLRNVLEKLKEHQER
jgi:tetratricopeptide (TPR) repeat protein